jgi:hypothetical protein
MRPRFRTTSLLWLMAIVTAFFAGRQSDLMVTHLSQLWESMTGEPIAYNVINQPDGSILICCNSPVPRVRSSDSSICIVELIDAQRIRVKQRDDGDAAISIWMGDGTALPVIFSCGVNRGNLTRLDW